MSQPPDDRARPQAARPRPEPAAARRHRAPSQGRVLDPATAIEVEGVEPRPTVYVGPRLLISKSVDFDGALAGPARGRRAARLEREPEEEDPRTARAEVRRPRRPARRRLQPGHDRPGRLDPAPADPGPVRRRCGRGRRPRPRGVRRAPFNADTRSTRATRSDSSATRSTSTQPLRRGGHSEPVVDRTPLPGLAVGGSRSRTSGRRRAGRRREDGRPAAGRRDPRHRLRRAPVARRRRRRRASSSTACRSATTTRSPTRSCTATWSARSTASSTRSPGTARSSPAWSTRPAPTPTSCRGGSCLRRADRRVRPGRGPGADRRAGPPAPAGEPGGQAIDVLSLSMGYYHETPEDVLFDPTLYAILEDLRSTARWWSARPGNDATSRPSFPAAFAPWADGTGRSEVDPDVPADRVGRRAQPQRRHGRAVQQRRALGAHLRARAPR